MRTFIAIELPKAIKEALANLQEQLKKSGADVKWVKPENIHLTLKFLGEIEEKGVAKIKGILQEVALEKNSFSIHLASVGAFPKINSPRVIWVGIDQGERETKEIAKDLEEKITKVGIPKEKRGFSTHITIGRTRSNLHQELLVQDLTKLAGQTIASSGKLEFVVSKITLLKSTLTPKGPIYAVLSEANLKTA